MPLFWGGSEIALAQTAFNWAVLKEIRFLGWPENVQALIRIFVFMRAELIWRMETFSYSCIKFEEESFQSKQMENSNMVIF